MSVGVKIPHGLEFDDPVYPSIFSRSFLKKKGGPPIRNKQKNYKKQENRGEDNQQLFLKKENTCYWVFVKILGGCWKLTIFPTNNHFAGVTLK